MDFKELQRTIAHSELPEKEELLQELLVLEGARVDADIRERIEKTGDQLQAALESGESKRIRRTLRALRETLQEMMGKESGGTSQIVSKDVVAEIEGKRNANTEEKKEHVFPSFPNPPHFTQAMAKAFIEACGGKLVIGDTERHTITIDGETFEDSPRTLLWRVGEAVFGNGNAKKAARRYIELIAEGNSHEEAKVQAEHERAIRKFPDPPLFTQAMAKAFIEACGGRLDSRDTKRRTVTVDDETFADSSVSLLQRIGTNVFGHSNANKAARRYIELIAEGKSHEEAKVQVEEHAFRPFPNPPLFTQVMAKAFIEACGGKLTTRDSERRTVTIDDETFEDSPNSLLQRIGTNVFGKSSSKKAARRYIELIAEGKSHDEAKVQAEHERAIRKFPDPPLFTQAMAKAFIEACGGRLDRKDTERRVITIDGEIFEDSPCTLLWRISKAVFGETNISQASRFYIEFIAEGKSHEEAKAQAESERSFPRFPKPPLFTQAMAKAFIEACGGKLTVRDGENRTITIGHETFKDSPAALLRRIGETVFGNGNTATISRCYIELIAEGNTHEEAKAQAEARAFRPFPKPPLFTQAMAKAFIEACDGKLVLGDTERCTVTIDDEIYEDSPCSLLKRIGETVFGKGNTATISRRYIELIAEGMSHEEAKAQAESERSFPHFPNPPFFTQAMAKAFIESCGGKLTTRDTELRTITIDGETFEDSPSSLLRRIGGAVFGDIHVSTVSCRYIEFVSEGKTHEEAKRLAHLGEEGKEDVENEKLAGLNLEEVIAFFRNQEGGEMKLKIYLQFAHPELSEEEINRIVIRSFKNLYGPSGNKEEEYLRWEEELPPVEMRRLTRSTKDKTVTLIGRAERAECVYVSGVWHRRVRAQPDGTFQVTIPLKVGQENDIRIMGLDREKKLRSKQQRRVVKQEGKVDDIEALVRMLEELGDDLARQISEDPGRREYLAECTERVLIKKFGKSFKDGERYVKDLLKKAKKGIVRETVERVLSNFRWVEGMQLPHVKEDSLMFFQKYCAHKIREAKNQGKRGINICNDPGLGKTRTVWAAIASEMAVVFAPNSVVSAWNEEAHACLTEPDLLMLNDPSHRVRKEKLRGRTQKHMVTNTQFLQQTKDQERFDLISDPRGVAVFDEAHSRKNEHSEQSKGARKVKHAFTVNVTATLARNPVELRRMLHTLDPDKPEFKNDNAFRKAFPANDPQALKALKLIVDQYTIRFRKHEVMEEIDPALPLREQLYRLPKKEYVSPEDIGKFEMTEAQAGALYEMFMDWPAWCRQYGKYIPEDQVNKEDGLWTANGLAKLHAYRQVINNPTFINDHGGEDPKAWQAQRIVRKCLKEGRKAEIFCLYEAQALKYAELFKKYAPSCYIGQTAKQGLVRDPATGKPRLFSLDADENYVEDPSGSPLSMLEFERRRFQDDPKSKVLIATYGAGSVGTTFTAAKATIYDDLPRDCKEDIQAENRTHRIDPDRQTHATVDYYQMQARYPQRFLETMKRTWIRKARDEHGKKTAQWVDCEIPGKPRDEEEDNPWLTAYDAFFRQGTYDQVHSENLRNQRIMFHLINDGIADESELMKDQVSFFGLENGQNGTGNASDDENNDEDAHP